MLEFQLALNICGLRDMGFHGSKFTWSNKRDANLRVEVRLDRYTCYSTWETRFNFSRVQNISMMGFDLNLILDQIDFINAKTKGRINWGKLFHYEEH